MHAMRRHHMKHRQHASRHAGHMASAMRHGGQTNDNIADQLNREEASRIASPSGMGANGMGMSGSTAAPTGQNGPAAPPMAAPQVR
jgi:hypothetical protein